MALSSYTEVQSKGGVPRCLKQVCVRGCGVPGMLQCAVSLLSLERLPFLPGVCKATNTAGGGEERRKTRGRGEGKGKGWEGKGGMEGEGMRLRRH